MNREAQSLEVLEEIIEGYWLGNNWRDKTPDEAYERLVDDYTTGSSKGKFLNQIDYFWKKYKGIHANKHLSKKQEKGFVSN